MVERRKGATIVSTETESKTMTSEKQVYLSPEIAQEIRDSVDTHCSLYAREYVQREFDSLVEKKVKEALRESVNFPKVVVLKELSEAQAREQIIDYLTGHEEADTAELVEELGIDIEIVEEVIGQLKREGKVESVSASIQDSR